MTDEPDWVKRYLAPRWGLPIVARDAPDRCALVGDPGGTVEVWSWAPGTDAVQATRRPNGTSLAAINAEGNEIWWFADTDGDEFGVWHRQPFGSAPGADEVALTGMPAAYPAGLAFARTGGLLAVGGSDDTGSTLWLAEPGQEPRVLYRHEQDASVSGVSADGALVVISHSERGDNRHPALRAYGVDGDGVADLDDGPGKGLFALGFLGDSGDLLVAHERRGRSELLVWSLPGGHVREVPIDLPGELSGAPGPEVARLLVTASERGRTNVWELDLGTDTLTPVALPRGEIDGVRARVGGGWVLHSSAATPPTVVDLAGTPVLPSAGEPAPPSVPVEDVFADGPGGTVHAFLRRPSGDPPYATVFVVHGGPTWHDADAWSALDAAWVDAGYAVITVNYRGSTGYGSAWRDAIDASPGFVELADVAAVRDTLVANRVVDPARCVLTGGSWGGFLTLLGLGTQPELWAAGCAAVPVADYVAAYDDEMEALKAFDRAMFGGSPADVPEAYEKASPLTYVDQVRAPLLILAGENDPRCPIRQIENYLAALDRIGTPYDIYRFDAGHGSYVATERIRQTRAELEFVTGRVPPG